MPIFQPPLSTSLSISSNPPSPHLTVKFDATFEPNEDQSGTWEIWTDIPALSTDGTPKYASDQWHAISFDKSSDDLVLHVEVLTPANVGSSWAYTYRRVFQDGNIHWLGGPGSNGEIKVVQGEEAVPAVSDDRSEGAVMKEETARADEPDDPEPKAEGLKEEVTSAAEPVVEVSAEGSKEHEEEMNETPVPAEEIDSIREIPSSESTEPAPPPVLQICPTPFTNKIPATNEETVSRLVDDEPSAPGPMLKAAPIESEEDASSSDITDSTTTQSSTEAPQTVSTTRPIGQSQDLVTFFSIFKALGSFLSNIWSWFFATAHTKVKRAHYEGEVDDLEEPEVHTPVNERTPLLRVGIVSDGMTHSLTTRPQLSASLLHRLAAPRLPPLLSLAKRLTTSLRSTTSRE